MKTNLLGFFLLLCCTSIFAQKTKADKWNLGLLLALDQNQTEYVLSDWVLQGVDEIKNLDARAGLGFSAGLTAEYQLNPNSSLRFSPLFSLQRNSLTFIDQDNNELTIDIHPTTLGFPLHFIYAPRGRDKIPYFFIGPRIQTQVGNVFDPKTFSIASTNLMAEFGVGMTINSELISFAPQISFSQGLTNLKAVGESGFYNNAVRNLRSNRLTLGVILGLNSK